MNPHHNLDPRLLGLWVFVDGDAPDYQWQRDWVEFCAHGPHELVSVVAPYDRPMRMRFALSRTSAEETHYRYRLLSTRNSLREEIVSVEFPEEHRLRLGMGHRSWFLERVSPSPGIHHLYRRLLEDFHRSPACVPLLYPHLLLSMRESPISRRSPELRIARAADVLALEQLIRLSARKLQAPYYSDAQIEAALGPVFAVDRELIADETYFVITNRKALVAAGGWSRRKSLFGGDRGGPGREAGLLDPKTDAARIRAFFVHPDHARKGHGRALLHACEMMAQLAGFRRAELCATLAGEPLYAKFGYAATRRYEVPLAGGLGLPVVAMERAFDAGHAKLEV